MASGMATAMTLCKFHLQGNCKNGVSCNFSHQAGIEHHGPRSVQHNVVIPGSADDGQVPAVCTFFVRGACTKGDNCRFSHTLRGERTLPFVPRREAQSLDTSATSGIPHSDPKHNDSRGEVLCKYQSRTGGCQKTNCPFLHDDVTHSFAAAEGTEYGHEDVETCDDVEDDSTRAIAGASVLFDEYGGTMKVSLDTDYSWANLTGLEAGATDVMVKEVIRSLGMKADLASLHISVHTTSQEAVALIRVEDPNFAEDLSTALKDQRPDLKAIPVIGTSGQVNSRKLYISWHRGSRTVWMNFGRSDIATRVACKFNTGKYRCLGQAISTSSPTMTSRGIAGWTIILNNVPAGASRDDIVASMIAPDAPRNIELGPPNHHASDVDVSVQIREQLEKHGQLESFHFSSHATGKRAKATALFHAEADARLACSLNNKPLAVLGKGKINVEMVYSATTKISLPIYNALKSEIDRASRDWREQHSSFRVYPDGTRRFVTLKVEGTNMQGILSARKKLFQISRGTILTVNGRALWHPSLRNNGTENEQLKSIATELNTVIQRDKSRNELLFYGPEQKLEDAVRSIASLFEKLKTAALEIQLTDAQFSNMIHGSFSNLECSIGKGVAIFDVVSRKIVVSGSEQQRSAAQALIEGHELPLSNPNPEGSPGNTTSDCPICFCEPENPICVSCQHSFCAECFEGNCDSAAATSKSGNFQIRCPGSGGTCTQVFTLQDIKPHLPSSVFEAVLQSSFTEYIKQHPQDFRYCPTPDCGYIYRCTTTTTTTTTKNKNKNKNAAAAAAPRRRCPNCLEEICLSCYACHGAYTCAEHKDIESGGHEATEKLKKKLNIQHCPKCSTAMEKTEGCNHMTCPGCRAHICWVCLDVFENSGDCYEHMNQAHGGIGLNYLGEAGF